MVRKIKNKKVKTEVLEEWNFFDGFLNKENFTEEDEYFESFFEKQEEEAEKFYSSVPLTLDVIEEIIERGKKLPSGKVEKIKVRENYEEEFAFLLLCLDGIFNLEKIEEINSESDYLNYEKEMGKYFLARYKIDSVLKLNRTILYLLNNGAVETWKEYIEAESLEKALGIPEIKKSKKEKERKYEFVKRFKNKVSEDIMLGWSLKEALILARYGSFFGYFSEEQSDNYIKLIIIKLIKNYKNWKEYGISCLVGELLKKYQIENKKITYGDLYYEIEHLEELLSKEEDGDWLENPWLQL